MWHIVEFSTVIQSQKRIERLHIIPDFPYIGIYRTTGTSFWPLTLPRVSCIFYFFDILLAEKEFLNFLFERMKKVLARRESEFADSFSRSVRS